MKAVVDTNVFVSAALGGGNALIVRDAFLEGRFELVTTPELLDELATVLVRPRFRDVIGKARMERILADVVGLATVVSPAEPLTVCRDPKDNALLEAAVAGGADVVVTGDADLLVLKQHDSIDIITLAAFVRLLELRTQ